MTEMVPVKINGRWDILLPDFRAERPDWTSEAGWERERLDAMHDIIKPGDVVYDIGSEEGDLSALYASWGAQVLLVEPNPRVWPHIRAIWEANHLSAPLGYFVGFAANFYRSRSYEMRYENGWPHVAYGVMERAHSFLQLGGDEEGSAVTTIDKLSSAFPPPCIITIDVEGAEWNVLNGAIVTLQHHHPIVFCSIHPQELRDLYGMEEEDIHNLLRKYGYQEEFLAEDHERHWMYR